MSWKTILQLVESEPREVVGHECAEPDEEHIELLLKLLDRTARSEEIHEATRLLRTKPRYVAWLAERIATSQKTRPNEHHQ